MKKIVTYAWYSNDMFRYMFKAKFVTLVSLKVQSGSDNITYYYYGLCTVQ